jgi:hypothetical protein
LDNLCYEVNFNGYSDNIEPLQSLVYLADNIGSTVTSRLLDRNDVVSAAVNPAAQPTEEIFPSGLAFSRGTYTPAHALFMVQQNGKIFRLDNPQKHSTAMPDDITPSAYR